jgi:FkbH-like protein
VAQQLPDVAVIDMPDDPSGYCAAVELAKVFPMHRLTQEDLNRTASYRKLAEAKSAASAAPDMDAFLRDLDPVATIEAVDAGTLDRIVQLIGKTNQFKLNPTVFSHEQIRQMAPGVVALRMQDRLQDYGIVAIAVTEMDDGALVVRNWVMSCRVFSRRLEHAMRVVLAELADQLGVRTIRIDYIPSAKNGLVPAALKSIGFTDRGGGLFETEAHVPAALAPHHMTIRDRRESAFADVEGAN